MATATAPAATLKFLEDRWDPTLALSLIHICGGTGARRAACACPQGVVGNSGGSAIDNTVARAAAAAYRIDYGFCAQRCIPLFKILDQ